MRARNIPVRGTLSRLAEASLSLQDHTHPHQRNQEPPHKIQQLQFCQPASFRITLEFISSLQRWYIKLIHNRQKILAAFSIQLHKVIKNLIIVVEKVRNEE